MKSEREQLKKLLEPHEETMRRLAEEERMETRVTADDIVSEEEVQAYLEEASKKLDYIEVRHLLACVEREREAQHHKWGKQEHPDGTGPAYIDTERAEDIGADLEESARYQLGADETWAAIFLEEVGEALQETDPEALAGELIQVAAVCLAWIEDIRRGNSEILRQAPSIVVNFAEHKSITDADHPEED